MGSTTKMYTAAAVLRLVDAGKIGLDDKALPLMDTLFKKLNGTSLAKILGPEMEDVTVRQLLQMRSGIPDFDSMSSRSYQLDHPDEDLGPVKEISFLEAGADFDCQPGTCGEYSSTNYELLGLLLAQQAGANSWDTYDQASGLPAEVLAEMPNTTFPVHGPCSKYTDVHGYSSEQTPPVDAFYVSCTGGWTCENLLSSGADAAVFVRALLGKGERVLTAATQREMQNLTSLTQGWSTGLEYGLGLMDISRQVGERQTGLFVGHGGETYGFNAQTGYMKEHDVGISIVGNTENILIVGSVTRSVYTAVKKAVEKRPQAAMIV